MSSGTVTAANDVVASGTCCSSTRRFGAPEFASIAGAGLDLGANTIAVTQASAGATIVGGAVPESTTDITAANDQLSVSIDGAESTFTFADGSYTTESNWQRH